MSNTSLRIHPSIGMVRVGNSPEYILGPETMAAEPQEGTDITGGLPIVPNTESTTIKSNDLRDAEGRLKRQAARFRIYQYPNEGGELSYPTPGGEEVKTGSVVNGKTVASIIWTAHLANKKANCWDMEGKDPKVQGLDMYKDGNTPAVRNQNFGNKSTNPADPDRLKALVIDAGPRAIDTREGQTPVKFDTSTEATAYDRSTQTIQGYPHYPIQFPQANGTTDQGSSPINYLGELSTEPETGRLIVLGGMGLATGFDNEGQYDPAAKLCDDVDNNNWMDDTSDGPVTAVLVYTDGSQEEVPGGAWVVVTDPSYAPQTLNVVSLWDDTYNTWLEEPALNLQPEVYNDGKYQSTFKPYFPNDVYPTLNAAHMQRWNTNLPEQAVKGHARMSLLTEQKPGFDIMSFIRNPNDDQETQKGSPLMPLSLGDSPRSYLTISRQQYFFMEQWAAGLADGVTRAPLGAGEQLDKTILVNCLGGRFSPGLEMTFIVRDVNFWDTDWKNPAVGPFRVNAQPMDYSTAQKDTPFLGVGYTPLRPDGVEPGDVCKFMAIPWHTDYNSCATHTPSLNPGGNITNENVFSGDVNTTLYWSWPAQRPVAVYTYQDVSANNGDLNTTKQRFSVRGEGTEATLPNNPDCPPGSPPPFNTPAMNVGRYQERRDFLTEWTKVGTIIQGPAIDGYPDTYDKDYYLEVASLYEKDDSNLVVAWPNTVTDPLDPPPSE